MCGGVGLGRVDAGVCCQGAVGAFVERPGLALDDRRPVHGW